MPREVTIILRMRSASALFIAEESPFYGIRMIKKEYEDFLVERAAPARGRASIKIKVELATADPQSGRIENAIRQHFEYRKNLAKQEIKNWLNRGWTSLLIAFIFLGLIFLVLEFSKSFEPGQALPLTVKEFLIILGWVALWKPADLLLYEWRPHKREAVLYERLENASIEILSNNS
jgi:hypothetical protein